MPYIARTAALSQLALNGGLVDPRADPQPSFDKRMSCRDVTDFISNQTQLSPLELQQQGAGAKHAKWGTRSQKPASENQAKVDKIFARSKEIRLALAEKAPGQPLSDLVPGLVVTGGLSRSPAFDCLPVVSHWIDRTGESSTEDPAAAVRFTSTWGTIHVIGEGATMHCPLGAPC